MSELEAILQAGEERITQAFNDGGAHEALEEAMETLRCLRAALRVAVSEITDAGSLCDSHSEPDVFVPRVLAVLKGENG